MKKLILLPIAAAILLAGCETPQPVVVDRHHHHYYQRDSTPSRPYKATPSITHESPSEFRAVEKAD